MRRTIVTAVAAVLVVTPLIGFVITPTAAHGNHLTARSQVSADGTVVVESLFILESGYLVIHESDGGEPGDIIGQIQIDRGYQRGATVQVDESWWENQSGTTEIVAVLHRDAESGDDFDPAVDTPVNSFGSIASSTFSVRKGDTAINLVATKFSGHSVEDSVTIPSVELAEVGYLVVRTDDDGTPGEVVGYTTVDAGTNTNVTVPVDREAIGSNGSQIGLWVTVYQDDGDNTFDSEDDPVVVGDNPVQSRIVASIGSETEQRTIGINTPTETPPGDDSPNRTTSETGGEETGTPAVGVVGTLAAIIAAMLLAISRR